ncbi:MAG: PSD1 and planctomycete cytochrome C domain-containing protein [Planctomycetaceae bacterium]
MPGRRRDAWGAAAAWLAPLVAFAAPVDFAHEIVPLLRTHCGRCHTGGARQGGYAFDTHETALAGGDGGRPAVVPGRPETSELVRRITSADPDERMPAEGAALPPEAVALLTRWIDEGAAWEPGFSFRGRAYEPPLALAPVTLPAPVAGRTHPVDRILDATLGARGIDPLPPCDDATFVRRASLDFVGLLPAPERVAAFVADTDPDKRRRLVDELLADDLGRAEHWMTFWNDLLRNDYTGTGFITGGRRQITTWLHRALVDAMPFDRFVRELIAPDDTSRGFADGIVWRGTVNASQTVPIQFAQNLGQTFLGINLKCASCHDSFVDRWTLRQTYDLAAIVASGPLELERCDVKTGIAATPAWPFAELGQVDPAAPPEERRRQLAALVTDPGNGWLSRTLVNRVWARTMGRGIVHPVDALRTPPFSADLLDWLAADFVAHGWDVNHLLRTIGTSAAYGAATPPAPDPTAGDAPFRGPLPRRLTAEQFTDALWQLTGTAPDTPDAEVTRVRDTPGGGERPPPMVRAALVKCTPLQRALGRPNRDQVVTSRPTDLSTLEAIQLANAQPLADTLAAGGARILAAHGPDGRGITRWLFAAALARPPTPAEEEESLAIVGPEPDAARVADLLWTVLLLPEFQFVR